MEQKTLFEIPIYAMSEKEFNKRWDKKKAKIYDMFISHGHTDKSAYVIQYNNGNIVAGCHHNSCSENNWSTLRSKYEPTNKVTNELEE